MATPAHPAPARHAVGNGPLWFGLFGAPAAWSVQMLAGYAFSAHRCFPGDQLRLLTRTGPIQQALLVIAVIGLVVAAAAGFTAFNSWRRSQGEKGGSADELLEGGEGRIRFMAFSGMLLSGLFAIAVMFNAIPPLLVPACGVGR